MFCSCKSSVGVKTFSPSSSSVSNSPSLARDESPEVLSSPVSVQSIVTIQELGAFLSDEKRFLNKREQFKQERNISVFPLSTQQEQFSMESSQIRANIQLKIDIKKAQAMAWYASVDYDIKKEKSPYRFVLSLEAQKH